MSDKKCLVTRLADSVDNPNLPVFRELILPVKAITDGTTLVGENARIGLRFNQATTVTVDGDGYFATSFAGLDDPATRLTEYTFSPATSGYPVIYLKNDNYNLRITNKYALNFIYTYASVAGSGRNKTLVELDMENLQYLTSLSELEINFSAERAIGDIKYLATNPVLTKLTCAGDTQLFGDIKDIASKLKLTILMIYNTQISGSVEDLVAGQVAQGITTPDNPMSARGLLKNLKFGGVMQPGTTVVACLTWNGTSVIYFGEGSSSSIDACTTIYAKGASPTQVAAWENDGKTVVVVS